MYSQISSRLILVRSLCSGSHFPLRFAQEYQPKQLSACVGLFKRNFSRFADVHHDGREIGLYKNLPQYMVWGAGTDVGKTLVSAGLCFVTAQKQVETSVLYLKPVQTGFPVDSDSRIVSQVAGLAHTLGSHAHQVQQLQSQEPSSDTTSSKFEKREARTEFAWKLPASPHLARAAEGNPVSCEEINFTVRREISRFSSQAGGVNEGLVLVETAGGVCSPAPDGTLQLDALRPLRLPGVLVGDARLGGISATVTALESLNARGYDTGVVVVLDDSLGNAAAVKEALGGCVPGGLEVVVVPGPLPVRESGAEGVREWCERPEVSQALDTLLHIMKAGHMSRLEALTAAAPAASEKLWWPFTQHALVKQVTVIDSRCGEDFQVFRPNSARDACNEPEMAAGSLSPSFDACASWWTQGVSAEQHPALVRAVAYAAGRYGHVMFPENCHAPALACATKLLDGPGKGWASRVFFSDNGSTGIEVAIKMAFRKFLEDHPEILALADTPQFPKMQVVGLEGCYHGDTLGAMDCQGPGPFTGDLQFPWYTGRGLWLDPGTFSQRNGEWTVDSPAHLSQPPLTFPSRQHIFCPSRDQSQLAELYLKDVREKLDSGSTLAARENSVLGGLILEPALQGAGGMLAIDPLFQRVLMRECKRRKIPVILDEVFSGIWRLGRESAAELIGETPDIACYAKLLTGGIVPLAATLATAPIFDAFHGDSKLSALLHGHSYTAHAIGCEAANAALSLYKDPALNPNWQAPRSDGSGGSGGSLVEMWDPDMVSEISKLSCIDRAFSLGTVFVCEVAPEAGSQGGYNSSRIQGTITSLRNQGVYARPLGNVLYLMCTPTTAPKKCLELLNVLYRELQLL